MNRGAHVTVTLFRNAILVTSVVSHKYAYESAGPFGRRLRTSLRA